MRLSDPVRAAEQIADRARETPFAAIVGVDDPGVMAAALGAERLGLAHNPPAAVARTRNKAAMRRALAEAGVPQPRFALLPAGVDAAAVERIRAISRRRSELSHSQAALQRALVAQHHQHVVLATEQA